MDIRQYSRIDPMRPILVNKDLSLIISILIICIESDLAKVLSRYLRKFKPVQYFNPIPMHMLIPMYISFLCIVLFC